MAAAARLLQWQLLFICFLAVFRPISTMKRNTDQRECPDTSFRQPDGAGGASSVRGPTFPVWQLLVHFGRIECRVSRRQRRKLHRHGPHEPARYLLLPQGMPSIQTPLELLTGKLIDFNKNKHCASFSIFVGRGTYFLILLLLCADVESNPGPNSFEDNFALLVSDKERISALWDEIFHQREENAALEKRITVLEINQRRRNAVIFGVPTKSNLNNVLDNVFFEKLKLNKPSQKELVSYAKRFGKDGPNRPILVEFNSEEDKKQALRLAPRLKGTEIFLSDDLTPEQRLVRRKVVNARKKAAERGISAKVVRRGLLIGEKVVPPEELDKENWLDVFLPSNPRRKSSVFKSPVSPSHEKSKIQVSTPSAPFKDKAESKVQQNSSKKWKKIELSEKSSNSNDYSSSD